MKKISLIAILTVLIVSAVALYINNKASQQTNNTTATNTPELVLYGGSGPFNYKNKKLLFSFTTNIPLFERNPGGGNYLIVSENTDPHFYQTKECALADSKIPNCIAFEIQKVDLPGQKKQDIINALDNRMAITNNLNTDFDFYKQTDPGSPGWAINYFAVSKTKDIYFNILSFATSSELIEKQVLSTFKELN